MNNNKGINMVHNETPVYSARVFLTVFFYIHSSIDVCKSIYNFNTAC